MGDPLCKRKVKMCGTKLVLVLFLYTTAKSDFTSGTKPQSHWLEATSTSMIQVRDPGTNFSEFHRRIHTFLCYLIQGSELAGLRDEALVAQRLHHSAPPQPHQEIYTTNSP